MSRIAYIISAYKDAPHLARLVAALDDRADFYVHIDLNADIHPFEEALGDKVTFVPRHRISWGGWEQVEYQKELNPEKPDVPLNKNDAFQKVQKRRVQEKR